MNDSSNWTASDAATDYSNRKLNMPISEYIVADPFFGHHLLCNEIIWELRKFRKILFSRLLLCFTYIFILFAIAVIQRQRFYFSAYLNSVLLLYILFILFPSSNSFPTFLASPPDKDPVNAYCWIYSTFTVSRHLTGIPGISVASPGVGQALNTDQIHQHRYYQWVRFEKGRKNSLKIILMTNSWNSKSFFYTNERNFFHIVRAGLLRPRSPSSDVLHSASSVGCLGTRYGRTLIRKSRDPVLPRRLVKREERPAGRVFHGHEFAHAQLLRFQISHLWDTKLLQRGKFHVNCNWNFVKKIFESEVFLFFFFYFLPLTSSVFSFYQALLLIYTLIFLAPFSFLPTFCTWLRWKFFFPDVFLRSGRRKKKNL